VFFVGGGHHMSMSAPVVPLAALRLLCRLAVVGEQATAGRPYRGFSAVFGGSSMPWFFGIFGGSSMPWFFGIFGGSSMPWFFGRVAV